MMTYVSNARLRRIEKRREEAEKRRGDQDPPADNPRSGVLVDQLGRYAGFKGKRDKEKSRVTLPGGKRPNPERSDHRGAWDGDDT